LDKRLIYSIIAAIIVIGLIIYYFYKQGAKAGANTQQKFANVDTQNSTVGADLISQYANGVLDEYNKSSWYYPYSDDTLNNTLLSLDDTDLKLVYNFWSDNIHGKTGKTLIEALNNINTGSVLWTSNSQDIINNLVKRLQGLGAI
jgi:c-di-AMP phosphodiesterase-like protein